MGNGNTLYSFNENRYSRKIWIGYFQILAIGSVLGAAESDRYEVDDRRIDRVPIKECGIDAVDAAKEGIPILQGSSIDPTFKIINKRETRYFLRPEIIEGIKIAQGIMSKIIEEYNLVHEIKFPILAITLLGGYCPYEDYFDYFERAIKTESAGSTLTSDFFYHKIAAQIQAPYTERNAVRAASPCCASQAILVVTADYTFGNYRNNICKLLGLSRRRKETWNTFYIHPNSKTQTIRTFFLNALAGANLVNYGKIHLWGAGDPHAAFIAGEKEARYGIWPKLSSSGVS